MNIAVYTHYFTPEISAPSMRIHDMAREWIRLGHRVQVITCFPNHPNGRLYPGYGNRLYMHEVLDGIQVHRHWTLRASNHGFVKRTLGHLSYLPAALLVSNRHIDRPDVVLGSSPTFLAASAAARTGQRYKVPFVMEVRDLWPAVLTELDVVRNKWIYGLLESVELGLYARAKRVVTVTDSFRHDLVSRGVPSSKVITIPNGADLGFWTARHPTTEIRQRLGLENCFVVLYIGTHGISHGLGAALKSAAELRQHSEVKFVFVGSGADKPHLMQQARDMQLTNVQFLEPVSKDKVRDHYAMADVCLLPLRDIKLFDGFIPSKMFEMMAMERPIIGAVRGEAATILRRSNGAVVVEPENATQISQAILELQGDPGRRRAMGVAARQFVEDHYGRDRLAKSYANLLEDTVQEGKVVV